MGCCASITNTANEPSNEKVNSMSRKSSQIQEKKSLEENKSNDLPVIQEGADNTNSSEIKPKVPKLDLTKVPEEGNAHNKNANIVNQPQNGEADLKLEDKKEFSLSVSPDIFVSLKKGRINDYYKIGKTLGEGAYGRVYQVSHRGTGIVRAMKAIKKKSVLKEEAQKLFGEVSILKELDHPHIVKLYELYQDDLNYYLVTEFCTGGELFDRIHQSHNFSEKQAAHFMKQILSAVAYCHSKKIVHRDLKPENMLLDSTKPGADVKVIDFGLSRKFETGKKMEQKFGTAYYMAPEVIDKNYDEKCDVWSCGVIMYVMLCGYPPFAGKTSKEIFQKIKIGKYTFDPEDWGKISDEAKKLIKKMLAYKPEDRISAKDAYNDPWIQKNTLQNPLNPKALKSLSDFRSKSKLRDAILTFIVTQMTTHKDLEELKKTFSSLDKDGNGVLNRNELIEGYKKAFPDKAEAEAEVTSILGRIDGNNSGQVDFTEFIMAAMNYEKLLSKDRIEQAFKLFDNDGDGFITRSELANVMGGLELEDEQWKKLVEEVDTNKDGKISHQEFLGLLSIMTK